MTHSFPTRRSADLTPPSGQSRTGRAAIESTNDGAFWTEGDWRPYQARGFGHAITWVHDSVFAAGVKEQCHVSGFHPCACDTISRRPFRRGGVHVVRGLADSRGRSEEHTSELQSLMRISYAVFCLKKNNRHKKQY